LSIFIIKDGPKIKDLTEMFNHQQLTNYWNENENEQFFANELNATYYEIGTE